MRFTRLNLWCCGRRRGQFRLERSPAVCGIWPVTHREVVPPAQRGPGTVRRPPGGLGGASGTPPERFRACSALANPHGVTHHPEVGQGVTVHGVSSGRARSEWFCDVQGSLDSGGGGEELRDGKAGHAHFTDPGQLVEHPQGRASGRSPQASIWLRQTVHHSRTAC